MNLLAKALVAAAFLAPTLGQGAEAADLKKGWIAQSYAVPVGELPDAPTSLHLNSWHEDSTGLLTTDYLFALDSQRTFIFNAGIQRSGGIRFDQPGAYRIHLYADRFLSTGQPECLARIALDGEDILKASSKIGENRERGAIEWSREAGQAAYNYAASVHAQSAVFHIDQPGIHRVDFWSVCRDVDAKTATYKLSNELGNYAQKNGWFSSKLQRIESFYGGDSQVMQTQKSRMAANPIKQIIAENHSTMFDIVLEDMETGNRGRVGGDSVYHLASETPDERLSFATVKPASEGSFKSSKWHFTAVRGENKATHVQRDGYSPAWASAAAQMPFAPTQMEARKRLTIREDGAYDLAIGYEPDSTATFLLGWARKERAYVQQITSQKSENATIYLEQKMADGRVRRLKMFDAQLIGSNAVGELRFIKMNLKVGEYDIVISRDINFVSRDRYGTVDMSKSIDNSQISMRLKKEGDEGFAPI